MFLYVEETLHHVKEQVLLNAIFYFYFVELHHKFKIYYQNKIIFYVKLSEKQKRQHIFLCYFKELIPRLDGLEVVCRPIE